MIVSFSRMFIFVKIPKTAGSSIKFSLWKYCDPKRDSMSLGDENKGINDTIKGTKIWSHEKITRMTCLENFDKFYKFGFVRNPWDQVVSKFWYDFNVPRQIKSSEDFGEIVSYFQGWLSSRTPLDDQWWQLQHKLKIAVDFVGRFENLKEDYAKVAKHLGIDPELKFKLKTDIRKFRNHYSEYYTQQLVDKVAKEHKKSIECFGYEF